MTLEELKSFFKADRFVAGMGAVITQVESGKAVVELDIEEKHLNANDVVQGGVMFTLADFACAVAANADEIAFVSADGTISYLNACKGKKLIAEAKIIKSGKTLTFCETNLTDENGKLIAKASFTMCRVK